MAWLVSEGRVLASAEVAPDRRSRARGLLGRDGIDGAMVIEPCRWVHTIGMRFPIDVAYLDADGVVVKIARMRRRRVGRPVFAARRVVEAAAGAFARWDVQVGCTIEVRGEQQGTADDPRAASKGVADGAPAPGEPGGTSDAARTAADDTTGRDRRRGEGSSRPDREPGDSRRVAVLVAAS